MDWVSLVILATLGLFAINGAQRGFVRQVLGLAGTIVALILAFQNFEEVGDLIMYYATIPRALANVLGFAIVCAIIIGMVSIIGHVWSRFIRLSPISILDSLGGAGFGLLKGFLIVCIILIILISLPFKGVTDLIGQSSIARQVLAIAPLIYERVEKILPPGAPRLIISPDGIRLVPAGPVAESLEGQRWASSLLAQVMRACSRSI
ncbi:MAG TPA: CvpA family protein [Firmicutes bacterium]|nr:CvpA family protein [Bacillota bacterium]